MKRGLITALLVCALATPAFAETSNLAVKGPLLNGALPGVLVPSLLVPAPVSVAAAVPQSDRVVVKQVALPAKKRPVNLPGVGSYVLDTKNSVNPIVVSASSDGTHVVMVSSRFPNRVATPFAAPRVIDSSNVDIVQDGSNIFLSPRLNNPFVIYVTGSSAGDQVISLTIMPKDIPAQTIILQADIPAAARQQKTESYTQQIVGLLREVASGKSPEGYSEGKMPDAFAIAGELSVLPVKRYSGSWLDIYQYTVTNNSGQTIEMAESSFYRKGVRAVSIFPNLILAPGEFTKVYVLADKTALDGGQNGR